MLSALGLLESMAGPAVIVKGSAEIIGGNAQWRELGESATRLEDMLVGDCIHDARSAVTRAQSGDPSTCTLMLRTRTGSRWVEARVALVPGTSVFLWTLQPHVDEESIEFRMANAFVERLPIGAVFVHPNGIDVNDRIEILTGYSRNELRTVDDWFRKLYPENSEAMRAEYERDKRREASIPSMPIRRKDGTEAIIVRRVAVDPMGELWLLREASHEQRVAKINARIERSAKIGAWELEEGTGALFWTEGLYHLLEVDPRTYTPTLDSSAAFFETDDRKAALDVIQRARKEGKRADLELRMVTARGRRFWCRAVLDVERAGDRIVRVVGSLQDIDERKKAEIELREREAEYRTLSEELERRVVDRTTALTQANGALVLAERRLRQIVDLVPQFVFAKDIEGRFLLVNEAVAQAYGTTVEGLLGKTDADFASSAEEVRQFREADLAVIRGGQPLVVPEERITDAAGNRRVLQTVKIPFTFSGSDVPAVLGVSTDITARTAAEHALADREARLRSVIESAGDGIIVVDAAQCIESANPAVARLFETPVTVGQPLSSLLADESKDAVLAFLRRVEPHGVTRCEAIGKRSGGGKLPVELSVSALTLGGKAHVLVLVRDVSEQKRLQQQFLESQKLDAIGRLAGGVAHDFNNLLAVILSYSESLLAETPTPEELKEDVTEILQSAERAAELTRQLLAFARRQEAQPQVVSLNATLTNLRKFLRRVVGEDVEMRFELEEDLAPVEIDPGQFEQVLLNLAVNARDAMRSGGRVTVRARNVTAEQAHALGVENVRDGGVEITVEDTGSGMTPEVLQRAFEPFFTTKPAGTGTGLGLATCYGIVKRFEGHIWAESALGKGSTFHVFLPRSDERASDAGAERISAPRGTGETILLVEDDDRVRVATTRVLQMLGYVVLSTNGGDEAIRTVAGHTGAINLVLSDVVMPGGYGPDVVARLQEMRPGLPAIFMTGYAEASVFERIRGASGDGRNVLFKPFSPAALALRLREVLDGQ